MEMIHVSPFCMKYVQVCEEFQGPLISASRLTLFKVQTQIMELRHKKFV